MPIHPEPPNCRFSARSEKNGHEVMFTQSANLILLFFLPGRLFFGLLLRWRSSCTTAAPRNPTTITNPIHSPGSSPNQSVQLFHIGGICQHQPSLYPCAITLTLALENPHQANHQQNRRASTSLKFPQDFCSLRVLSLLCQPLMPNDCPTLTSMRIHLH